MHCNMTAVLIVAHAPLASALRDVAAHVYADCGHPVRALDVAPQATPEAVQTAARALMADAGESDWLVLTDVYGATPCNAALGLAVPGRVRVVSGVNVPMLWRTLCYVDEPLDSLAARAVAGAQQGVMPLAPPVRPQNQDPRTLTRDPVDHHHSQ